ATLDRYWARAPEKRWTAGVDKMLIVSVGTGTSPDVRDGLDPDEMNLLFNASTIPSALMLAALTEQDLLCRVFGDCLAGDPLDREIDTLLPCAGRAAAVGRAGGEGAEGVHLYALQHRADARGVGRARLQQDRARGGAEARRRGVDRRSAESRAGGGREEGEGRGLSALSAAAV